MKFSNTFLEVFTENIELRKYSVLELYDFFTDILKHSNNKKMRFYAHFVLEYLACRDKYKKELREHNITIEQFYHYNQLFNYEFEAFEIEINRFLGYFPHVCRIIRPITPKEKGILVSNFIGSDKRYNYPLYNNWSERKRSFFKRNYYIFNHSCCKHIHHIEPIEDIDLLLVSDNWKKKEFGEQNPNINCIVSSDAFYVKTDEFKPKNTEKKYDLIYISRFDECKRNELLLESLSKLDTKIKLLLVLETYSYDKNVERKLRHLIEKYSLDTDIKIHLIRSELINIVNESKIAINLSKGSIDRSVFETLSMDLPLIYLKDNPCGKDIINDKTGLLVDPFPEKIAEAIRYLIQNRHKYSPRKWVLENYGEKLSNEKLKQAIKRFKFGSIDNVKYSPGELGGSCVGTYL